MFYDEFMKKRNAAYKEIDVKDFNESKGGELPDGDYSGVITDAKVIQSPKNMKMYVRFGIQVKGEKYNNFKTSKLYCISKPDDGYEDRIGFFKADMHKLGVELNDLEKIEGALEVVASREIKFTIRHKNGYCNLYINELLVAF